AQMIRTMGDKAEARRTLSAAGLPVVPGSDGVLPGVDEALALAKTIGYPVIIKAVAGGGGRGMRVAWDEKQLRAGLGIAKAEAGAAFGNDGVYLEKLISMPRHIEFQLFGGAHGNLSQFGVREFGAQRNHQKLTEEELGPFLSRRDRRLPGAALLRFDDGEAHRLREGPARGPAPHGDRTRGDDRGRREDHDPIPPARRPPPPFPARRPRYRVRGGPARARARRRALT